MKKRLLAIACAAAMVVTMFAGCNGGGESSTSSAAQESSGATSSAADESSAAEESSEAAGGELSVSGDVEIEFFQQKREAVDSFQAVIDAFMEQNPNITVTQNVVPDAATVLMTRAATNDIPEVLMHWPTDSQFVQLAQQGRLKVLDDTEALGNVMDNYLEAVKFEDGHYYCIPFSGNFMGVFYDVDKFEEAGYEIPTTWDELITIAEDIKSKGEVAFMFPDKDAWTLSQLQGNILGKDRPDSSEFYDQMDAGETTFQDDELTVQSWEKILQLHEYSQGDTLSLAMTSASAISPPAPVTCSSRALGPPPPSRLPTPTRTLTCSPCPTTAATSSSLWAWIPACAWAPALRATKPSPQRCS